MLSSLRSGDERDNVSGTFDENELTLNAERFSPLQALHLDEKELASSSHVRMRLRACRAPCRRRRSVARGSDRARNRLRRSSSRRAHRNRRRHPIPRESDFEVLRSPSKRHDDESKRGEFVVLFTIFRVSPTWTHALEQSPLRHKGARVLQHSKYTVTVKLYAAFFSFYARPTMPVTFHIFKVASQNRRRQK